MALAEPLPNVVAEPRRRISTVLMLQAFAIAVFIALASLRFVIAPLDENDEGVVVTKAMLVLAGHIPYRDFWATYGPLDTYLLAAAFKLIAVNIVVERLLGALCLVAVGAVAYAVFGRIGLKGSMRLLMTGLIAIAPLSVPAFNTAFLANLCGLIAVLAFLASLQRASRFCAVMAGVMTGLASFTRPEFAVALGSGLVIGYLVLVLRRHAGARGLLITYAGGALLGSAALWAPLIALAGAKPVWQDLVVYPLEQYPKGRGIPFGQGREGLIVIAFTVAFAAVWIMATVRVLRQWSKSVEVARLLALLVAGIAVFTWVRTRADGIHAFDAWPLTAVLLGILIQSRIGQAKPLRLDAIAGISGLLLFGVAAGGLALRDWVQPHAQAEIPRAGISGERAWIPADELAGLIRAIDTLAPPGQPIWVGLQHNDLVTFSDTMLYFLADRPPGTPYYEAFPGLTNTDSTEQAIACQLSSAGVRVVVLGPNPPSEPWNLSSVPGSRYLDQWLAQRMVSRMSIGPYDVLTLTPGVREADRCPSSDAVALDQGSPSARGTSSTNGGSDAPGSAVN